jgi:hypothetical protein
MQVHPLAPSTTLSDSFYPTRTRIGIEVSELEATRRGGRWPSKGDDNASRKRRNGRSGIEDGSERCREALDWSGVL